LGGAQCTAGGPGGQKSPSGVQGQSPGGSLGAKSPEALRMLGHEAEKNYLQRGKNKSIQADIV